MAMPDPPTHPRAHVSVTRDGQDAQVRLSGELDLSHRPQLEAAVVRLNLRSQDAVVVDLTAATFIDSTVLSWLVGLVNRADAEGGQVLVMAGAGPVRRVLEVSGVALLAPMTDPADAGVVSLWPGPPGA